MTSTPQLRIGDLTLSTGSQQVWRDGREVPLPRLSFAMLETLARHAPDVVSLDRLAEQVWEGVAISDTTVFQRVKLLRQALGDDSEAPRYVASIRGRGYRLVAPVEPIDVAAEAAPGASEPAPAPPPVRGRWRLGLMLVAVAGTLVALGLMSTAGRTERDRPPRLAVLPVVPLDAGSGGESLAAGVSEQLALTLSQIGRLRVIAGGPLTATGGRRQRVRDLGAALDVDFVLEGSVRIAAERKRVSLKLIDVASEELLWAQEYEGGSQDALTIQSEVAEHVALSLQSSAPDMERRMGAISVARLAALDSFHQGRTDYLRYQIDANELAIEHFERVLAVDPDFVLAQAWLANAYVQRTTHFGASEEWLGRAIELAREALRREPRQPLAYKALGMAYWRQGRLEGARQAYERALALRPGFVGVRHNLSLVHFGQGRLDLAFLMLAESRHEGMSMALNGMGFLLQELGLVAQADPFFERALEHDPFDPRTHESLASRDIRGGDYDAALTRLEKILSVDSRHPRLLLWACRAAMAAGQLEAAAGYSRRLLEQSESDLESRFLAAEVGWLRGERGWADEFFVAIERDERQALEQGNQDGLRAWRLAAVAALRGDDEVALELYRRAIDLGHRSTWWDRLEPAFAALREDPRFQDQLREIDADVAVMRQRVIDSGWHTLALASIDPSD